MKEVFIETRKRILEQLEVDDILILFAGSPKHKTNDEFYDFSQNRNYFYATGIKEEKGILFLRKKEDDFAAILFIQRDNGEAAKWVGANLTVDEAKEISGIEDVRYIDEFHAVVARAMRDVRTAYFDLERPDWDTDTPAIAFANVLRTKYPFVQLKDCGRVLAKLRQVKSESEVEQIRKAIAITRLGIEAMMTHCKPGMFEYEIENYFDFALMQAGIRNKAFKTIAAAGVNGCILHYMENDTQTVDGDLLLCDLGASFAYYNADITRTFPINGTFTQRQKEIYNIVLAANQLVIDMIKPGVALKKLNEAVKDFYAVELKKIGLIQEEDEVSNYYYHGVSHFLGLDTHDVGIWVNGVLEPGMVLTVEPGLYIEEENIGIRIEDNVLVLEDGAEVLSKDICKTVEDIEQFMAQQNR